MSQHVNPNETYDHKEALRRSLKERRAALTAEDRGRHHQRIACYLHSLLDQQKKMRRIALYLASPNEADLSLWMDSAQAAELQLFAPVVGAEAGQMDFILCGAAPPFVKAVLVCGNQRCAVTTHPPTLQPWTPPWCPCSGSMTRAIGWGWGAVITTVIFAASGCALGWLALPTRSSNRKKHCPLKLGTSD